MATPDTSIDQTLSFNESFTEAFDHGDLSAPPTRKIIVVTCMDARINVEAALGFKPGEAHILRNAGGSVTDDVLRSAIISTNLLGTRQIMVINHTKCGMMGCTDHDLHEKFNEQYGPSETGPTAFHTIADLDTHARAQVAKLKDHPWIPDDTVIRGFTYDVHTGRLHEVEGA